MTRLEAVAAWFFSCLGVALLGASVLVVPATAFADAGSYECSACNIYTPGTQQYIDCMTNCCNSACQGDPSCVGSCCKDYCGSDTNCLSACTGLAFAKSCPYPDPSKNTCVVFFNNPSSCP